MYKSEACLKRVVSNLAYISVETANHNSLGFFDTNRSAQGFYKGIFKIVFDLNDLIDLDQYYSITNFPSIDLGDSEKSVAFQVTTDTSAAKVSDTIAGFIKHEHFKLYKKLIFYIIGKKKYHPKAKFETNGLFLFDREGDVWDDSYLIDKVRKLSDDKLLELDKYLESKLFEYKNPDSLTFEDIKSCIQIIKRDLNDIIPSDKPKSKLVIAARGDDFIAEKNRLNEVSWDYFKEKIQKNLRFNPDIIQFLTEPVNAEFQEDYFRIIDAIKENFEKNKTKYPTLDHIFRGIFKRLDMFDDEIQNGSKKVRIILYNMYFNCDVGYNPVK